MAAYDNFVNSFLAGNNNNSSNNNNSNTHQRKCLSAYLKYCNKNVVHLHFSSKTLVKPLHIFHSYHHTIIDIVTYKRLNLHFKRKAHHFTIHMKE